MAERTQHYDLNTIGPGDRLSDDDYKPLRADRHFIDLLLKLGAETHHHTGDASLVAAPSLGPSLVLGSAGTIPAGTRVYYAYTLIDGQGFESAPSPTTYIDTPAAVASPGAPSLSTATTGGTLVPGNYYYVLSAYTGTNTSETAAGAAALITVPNTTSTNTITVTMPSLPAGATGFNVYRRKPGGSRLLWLRTVVPPTTSFVDNGSIAEDCDRTEPAVNTTTSSNSVTVTIVSPPAGMASWRLYRTYVADSWATSVLTTTTLGATPDLDYVDTGTAATYGSPPGGDQSVGAPSQILLTDAAETQGRAPLGSISAFPHSVEFEFNGAVTVHQGTGTWVCPFPQATIKGVRAILGRGYSPAVTPVIIDVNRSPAASDPPAYTTIFAASADRPQVPVAKQWGTSYPATGTSELIAGDAITVDIDQAGGGATPTDYDLTVVLYLWVYGFNLTSHTWT